MAAPVVTVNTSQNYADLSPLVTGGNTVSLGVLNAPPGATYNWTIVDQPPNVGSGAQATLSGPTTAAPTFVASNTGSYLVQCVLNQGTSSQEIITGVAFLRQLVSGERVPAANESTETDGLSATESGAGWAVSLSSLLRRLDTLTGDPGVVVGIAQSAGLQVGSFVAFWGSAVAGSPTGADGQTYPGVSAINATGTACVHGAIGVVIGGVNGGPVGGVGDFVRVRVFGLVTGIHTASIGSRVQGAPYYVTNDGLADDNGYAPGANSRVIGTVVALNTTADTYDVFICQAP